MGHSEVNKDLCSNANNCFFFNKLDFEGYFNPVNKKLHSYVTKLQSQIRSGSKGIVWS